MAQACNDLESKQEAARASLCPRGRADSGVLTMASASLGAGVEVPDFFKLDPPILATIRGLDISRLLGSPQCARFVAPTVSDEQRDGSQSAEAFRSCDITVNHSWYGG